MSRSRRARTGSVFASFLVLVGILTVLGVTFGIGVLTGRHLERAAARANAQPADPGPRGSRPGASGADAASDTGPVLSFYRELTAPIARGTVTPAKADAPEPHRPGPPVAESGSFTVQVAAYTTRAQADALRDRLAVRGIDADVTEVTTAAGVLHRVRVGNYPTRAAAREAAARLETDMKIGAIVAPR